MYILIDIGHAIVESLRTLALSIFEALLKGISILYDLFITVADYRLFTDETIIQGLYTRIGLVLGLFMIFRLTFYAVEYLINPDTMTDKSKGIGNIVKKVLIMIALLGSVHFLFAKAYEIQHELLNGSNNILSKLVFNKERKETDEAGKELEWTIFSSFYRVNEGVCPKGDTHLACTQVRNILNENSDAGNSVYTQINVDSTIGAAYSYVNAEKDGNNYDWTVSFDWFYGIVTAAFVLYILIVYIIQVGVRVIQLAYLEAIAPIPIMMYLTPKGDETLKKWGQQCLTTFLDAFIRIAILYFIILVVGLIRDSGAFTGGISVGIVLMLGLFMFAKKVPDLIGELFSSMGGKAGLGFGFSIPKEAKGLLTFGAGAALGAAGGMATGIKYGKGTAGGRLGGALTGFARGALGGAKTKGNIFANAGKGIGNQRAAMQRAYDRNNDGSDFWGRTLGAGDAARTKAAFDKELALYDAYAKNAEIVDSEVLKHAQVKEVLAEQQALMDRGANGGPLPTQAEIAAMDAKVKTTKQLALQKEMAKRGTSDENKTLMSALANAEAMRKKGADAGYDAFKDYTDVRVDDYADNFLDSVKATKTETNNIKGAGGTRNEAYKKAEANAKYARDK